MSRIYRTKAVALLAALSLMLSQWTFAQSSSGSGVINEDPTALAMTADLLLVRPAMFSFMVIGSAVWLVGLPFSAAGGNIKDSADTLVVGPAKNTFVRCLGCTNAGYQQTIAGN